MSTTTRLDTSLTAISVILLGEEFWKRLQGKVAERWAGIYKPRWQCWTFRIKLPQDIGDAFKLRLLCIKFSRSETLQWGNVRSPLNTLAGKLDKAIGFPADPITDNPLEIAIRESIERNEGGNLADWMAYSDFLQERDRKEGVFIARWMSNKVYTQKQLKEDRWQEYLERHKMKGN